MSVTDGQVQSETCISACSSLSRELAPPGAYSALKYLSLYELVSHKCRLHKTIKHKSKLLQLSYRSISHKSYSYNRSFLNNRLYLNLTIILSNIKLSPFLSLLLKCYCNRVNINEYSINCLNNLFRICIFKKKKNEIIRTLLIRNIKKLIISGSAIKSNSQVFFAHLLLLLFLNSINKYVKHKNCKVTSSTFIFKN